MPDCPPRATLERFLAGALADQEENDVCAHVEECSACQGELDDLVGGSTPKPRPAKPAAVPRPDFDRSFLERLRQTLTDPTWHRPPWTEASRDSSRVTGPDARGPCEATGTVPGYELISELGRGAMGVVYKAWQLNLGRLTALKMILAGEHAGLNDRARFRAEAEAAASLRHPNIVQVYEIGEAGGLLYFSMEYIEGETLKQSLAGTPQPPRAAALLLEVLARGVDYAHRRGIVHRDLKPANVLLEAVEPTHDAPTPARPPHPAGKLNRLGLFPKIVDFGLAKRLGETLGTRSGQLMGTPSYMSPEQFAGQGGATGPGVDIYALGCILYEALTGRPPFLDASLEALAARVRREEPVPPGKLQPKCPRDLETICLKCLEKEPARRYAGADDLADDLARFLAGESIRARPVGDAERAWRWCHRNPVVTILALSLSAALVVGMASTSWMWRQAEGEKVKVLAAEQVVREERDQAQTARDESMRLSAGVLLDKGLELAEKGEVSAGLFWMLEGLRATPADDRGLRRATRANLASWLGQAHGLRLMVATRDPNATCAFAPDGHRFVIGTSRGVRRWESTSGNPVGEPLALPAQASAVAFSPDGRLILVGTKLREGGGPALAQLFDAATGQPAGLPLPHPAAVTSIAFSPDGGRFATADLGGGIRLWDAATGRTLGNPFRQEYAQALAFSPDGHVLAIGTPAGAVHLRDLIGGKPLGPPISHQGALRRVAFHPDGRHLLTAGHEGGVQVWDRAGGQAVGPLRFQPDGDVPACFAPDGGTIICGAGDGVVRSWEVATGHRLVGDLPPQGWSLQELAVNAQGKIVLTLYGAPWQDKVLCLWQMIRSTDRTATLRSEGQKRTVRDEAGTRQGVTYSPDRQTALTADGRGVARLWDVSTGQPRGAPILHPWAIRASAFSPNGRRVAVASHDRPFAQGGSTSTSCRLYDAATGWPVSPPLDHPNWVACLAFSPDGTVLATGSYDGAVRFWDAGSGRPLGPPLVQPDIVLHLAYSPDGRTLAVGHAQDRSRQAETLLWDLASRRRRGAAIPYDGHFLFSSDGQRLMLRSASMSDALWDADTGRRIDLKTTPEDSYSQSEAFSPDGTMIVTRGVDGTARFWDASTGSPAGATWPYPHRVSGLAFSPDHDWPLLLLGHEDGTARLWDRATWRPIGPPVGHGPAIAGVAFSPDGGSFLTTDINGQTRVWPVPRPLAEPDLGRLQLRLEVRTGLILGDGAALAPLGPRRWNERRERLAALEGSAESAYEGSVDDLAWHEARARDAERDGDSYAAIWHLDRLIDWKPGDWHLYLRRARLHSAADRLDRADAEYARAWEHGPRDEILNWYRHRVADCEGAERWETALWYLDRLIASDPADWRAHERRAWAYGRLNRPDQREAELDRAVELGADRSVLLRLAAEYAGRGRWDKAADCYTRAIARESDSLPAWDPAWHCYALVCLRVEDQAGYRRVVRALLAAAGPTSSRATADVLAWTGSVGAVEAETVASILKLAERAVAELPPGVTQGRHEILNTLGAALYRAGRYQDSVDRLNEGIAVGGGPGLAQDWIFLAMAHHRLGHAAEARLWLAKVPPRDLEGSPFSWDALEVDVLRREAQAIIAAGHQ
jgi:eukaryotic-like serine/threonine-protein kinase